MADLGRRRAEEGVRGAWDPAGMSTRSLILDDMEYAEIYELCFSVVCFFFVKPSLYGKIGWRMLVCGAAFVLLPVIGAVI